MLKQRDLIKGPEKCTEAKAGKLDQTKRQCVIIKTTNTLFYKP